MMNAWDEQDVTRMNDRLSTASSEAIAGAI